MLFASTKYKIIVQTAEAINNVNVPIIISDTGNIVVNSENNGNEATIVSKILAPL